MCDKLVVGKSQVILKLESHRYQLVDTRHLTEVSWYKGDKDVNDLDRCMARDGTQ